MREMVEGLTFGSVEKFEFLLRLFQGFDAGSMDLYFEDLVEFIQVLLLPDFLIAKSLLFHAGTHSSSQ